MVASSWENLTYLSGVYVYTQRALRARRSALLLTSDGDATYIYCSIEEAQIRDATWIEDLRGYVEFAEDPIDMLIDVLRQDRFQGKRIGVERQYLGSDIVGRIEAATPAAVYVDALEIFQRMRAVKRPGEIALLAEAASATRRAHDLAFSEARPGDSEKVIANGLLEHLFGLGVDEMPFITVATGVNTLRTHHLAGETRIRPGDIVRTDVGGRFSGYYSDLGRTYVVGEPTTSQAASYSRLRRIQEEVIGLLTIGRPVREVFAACRAKFDRDGLTFHMPHIGHNIGLELHEWPVVHPGEDAVLAENMVFNIEPIFVDTATSELFFVEDLVQVTKDGPRLLSGGLAPEEIPVIA